MDIQERLEAIVASVDKDSFRGQVASCLNGKTYDIFPRDTWTLNDYKEFKYALGEGYIYQAFNGYSPLFCIENRKHPMGLDDWKAEYKVADVAKAQEELVIDIETKKSNMKWMATQMGCGR